METGIEAAKRASDHADRVFPEPMWSKIAWVRFLEFTLWLRSENRGHEGPVVFTMENFRMWAEGKSLPPPPDSRAFGNITRIAQQKGIIRKTTTLIASHNEHAHGREVRVWALNP